MQKCFKVWSALLVLHSFTLILAAVSFAQDREILRFEPGDTIEVLQNKIRNNGYQFSVGHNWVYDMSPEEKERFFSRRPPLQLQPQLGSTEDIGPLVNHLGKQLPTQFCWTNYNGHSYIGPIRDQGSCGSCYAFGACAAAEGTYNWATGHYDGNSADFSESYIIWCLGRLPQYSSHFFGCDGADYDYYELQALTVEGVTDEAHFPYTVTDPGSCTHWSDPTTRFASWYRVPCGDINAIKTAIMTYGVVDAAVYVDSAFEAYSDGIYENTSTNCDASPCYYKPTNHAIALVGWDDNGGNGYWILRNSWGPSWGVNGYMQIKYTSAIVACEVAYLVYNVDALQVSPLGGFSSAGTVGGPFTPAGTTYTLTNQGSASTGWTAAKTQVWLDVTPTNGSLAAGSSTNVSVSLNPAANGLAVGTYSDNITFSNPASGIPQTRTVTLSVTPSNTFVNPNFITIPDSGAATPYPSTITVSEVAGTVTKVTATLTNISHTYPDDIDVLLVGPAGQKVMLMSDAGGGYDINSVTLTFDDSAASVLPDSAQIVSGTFRPSDYVTGDTFPAPAPAGPYGTSLSVFTNQNPNGTWSLYVYDDAAGDSGSIANGWQLAITTSNSAPAQLVVTPTNGLSSTGTQGGPFTPSNQVYTLTNSGGNALNWSASKSAAWLSLSATNGTLPAAASTNVTVLINANANGLAPSNYTDTVTFTNATNGIGTTNRAVSLTVNLPPWQQWQLNYFGCTNCSQAAATADPDGDGQNNLAEFLVGTNPTNSASAFHIISIVQEGDGLRVTWMAGGSRTNVVQTVNDAGSGFTNSFSDLSPIFIIPGAGDVITNYPDVGGATNAPSRFYRVRLVP